ncbi:SDR family NAD(P)-dependent oxidoreductase [Goodfellowiella coeruleoviolacea]|uniref:NAD(P)-dependent dehydrogenase, short-chain alcohol dehydrogenase family n=1 Tax=Goodfellowiella coeruleoviolacea TaxID=334858 RepID=A0AAE3GKB3_9PSEU|nr:SDR family oxidoreductase [Goodfellowiella coeruleoviolacea]MCP2168789.1 NAD(P)-dependent dehydrogenase, short-chain alcohol dehydrogenase family [Goodfellowiella coeruleoviolacea]
MGLLQGRAVVITGAGRGLGEAYAMHSAQAGASVVVNDIDVELAEQVAERIRTFGGTAVASGHNVADPEQAAQLTEVCVTEFGRIDGLVNNAGLNYETAPWDDDVARIRATVEVNLLGTIYCGTAAMRAMREQGTGGSIVNISSGAFFGQRKLATYSATKGAVASLTLSWALDLETSGIRVNAVCPVAHTRMVWASERSLRSIPAELSPSRVAPLVLFLLSDSAEGITGQIVRMKGRQLHLVGQPYFKQPVLERENWDPHSVERAFYGVFQAHLEPFGLEKRVPPRLQELMEPSLPA